MSSNTENKYRAVLWECRRYLSTGKNLSLELLNKIDAVLYDPPTSPEPKPARVPKVGDIVLYHMHRPLQSGGCYTRPATVQTTHDFGSYLQVQLLVHKIPVEEVVRSEQGTGPGQWSFREAAE